MNKLLLIFLSLISLSVSAQTFCGRSQTNIKTYLEDSSSRISFKNNGGLFNGGVCWWHNRLQRSSAYLVKFAPELNPPTIPEVYQILYQLRTMSKVTIIPGYHDFETFTKDFKPQVQAMLNSWQKKDGFYNFEWLRGISGRSALDPQSMRLRMNDVYDHYKKSPAPLWIMAQIKGITSHSLLVLHMEQTENGYDLKVIDSNHPADILQISYYQGDVNLKAPKDKYTFVPYAGFQQDFRLISSALRNHCGDKSLLLDVSEIRDGEVERDSSQY